MAKIRFHLDESVSGAIADGLRLRGLDVTTPVDTGLLEADDPTHLAYANAEGRVLVTHDADFVRLDAAGVEHAGIAYCHQRKRSTGEMIRALVLIHECVSAEEMQGEVEFL